MIQGCSPTDPSPPSSLVIPNSKFPIDLIHEVIEYTPGNKRVIAVDEVKFWKDTLNKVNIIGYRPIPNSEKRSLRATFVFLGTNGDELFTLDQWEDGNISSGNDFFSID